MDWSKFDPQFLKQLGIDNPVPVPVPVENKFRLNSKKVFLTYKDHLPKQEYIKWIEEHVKQIPKIIEIAHETGDEKVPYLHSHVAIEFPKAIDTKSPRYFDYNGIHPNLKRITSNKQWINSLKYLAKEDPECAHLDGLVGQSIAEDVWEKETIQDAVKLAEKFSDVTGIIALYALRRNMNIEPDKIEYHPWQIELNEILETKPTNNRKIYWYCDVKGGGGKTTYARNLFIKEPNKYAYVAQCGGGKDFATILLNAINAGWNGHCIFFNLTRDAEYKSIYTPLEMVKDGITNTIKYNGVAFAFPRPHIIVFSNWLPNTHAMSEDRWIIKIIDEDKKAESLNINKIDDFRQMYYHMSPEEYQQRITRKTGWIVKDGQREFIAGNTTNKILGMNEGEH